MGTFSRMYNHVSRKGLIPVFNIVSNNGNIPLVFKIFYTKKCSVLGISKIMSARENQEADGTEQEEYIKPGVIDQFARRWDDVVKLGRLVMEEDVKKDMSLFEFCDR